MSFTPALGHEALHSRFAASLQAGRLHHGWLLHGVRGIGKATEAMAMAALYLCEDPRDGIACGQCHGCSMLRAESHPDFYRIELLEKKRDINVEQVRKLLDFLSLSGMESDRRVVLIDGADLMNMQAANALLKGLEEPSPGSLLLIVCHDLMGLPATIRSRCMLGHCAPLDEEQMNRVLAGMEFTDRARSLALRIAAGRPGHVQPLQDDGVAGGLADLEALLADIPNIDIGRVQGWLDTHLNNIPNELIADTVLGLAGLALAEVDSFKSRELFLATLWSIAAWPREVIRHTLRAAPALMALLLELRMQLRDAAGHAG